MSIAVSRLLPYLTGEHRERAISLLTRSHPVALAVHPNLDSKELDALAQHDNYRVRVAVALHTNTGSKTRKTLKQDKHKAVAAAARGKLDNVEVIRHLGEDSAMTSIPGMYPSLHSDLVASARVFYGPHAVDAALMTHSRNWQEVVDYALNRGSFYGVHDAVAAYCSRHKTLLRSLRSKKGAKTPENWATNQIAAALADSPEALESFLTANDNDVVAQALSSQHATIDHLRIAYTHAQNIDDTDTALQTFLAEAGDAAEALLARHGTDNATDIAQALRDTRDTRLGRRTRELATTTGDVPPYPDTPWKYLHTDQDLYGHVENTIMQVARDLHTGEPQALEVIAVLDADFIGSVQEMLAAARL